MVTGKPYKPSRLTRFVLYPFVGLVFLSVLTVILILANGFNFTYSNGKVGLVKTGMFIVTTRPYDGLVYLNGKPTKYHTGFYLFPTNIAGLTPGFYDIEVKKTGYRTWTNHLEISPNLVTWANYVLLFADKLNVSKIKVPTGGVLTQSQDGRHILFSDKSQPSFSLKSLDTNNLSVKDFWPSAGITDTWLLNPQILSASFSANNDRVLLSVQNGDKVEFVIIDATGAQPKAVKLSTNLGKSFGGYSWSQSNNNEVYLLDGSNLYLANVSDTTLGNPLVTDVVSFNITSSHQIYFVSKNSTGTYYLAKMNLDGSQKETVVDSVAPGKSYRIDYSAQNAIVSVLNTDTKVLESYYTGNSVKKYSLKMSDNVLGFGWSKNGQKLNYWGKDFAKRYDWEKNKEVSAALPDTTLSLDWYFDENHYFVTSDRGIYVIDYDGTNRVPISDGATSTSDLDQGNNNIIFSQKAAGDTTTFYKFISEF